MRLFLYPNALQKLSYSQNDFGHIISVRPPENPAFMRVSDISHSAKKEEEEGEKYSRRGGCGISLGIDKGRGKREENGCEEIMITNVSTLNESVIF